MFDFSLATKFSKLLLASIISALITSAYAQHSEERKYMGQTKHLMVYEKITCWSTGTDT